jgi:hypothetical protein
MVIMSAWSWQQPEASQDGESHGRFDIQVAGAVKQFRRVV